MRYLKFVALAILLIVLSVQEGNPVALSQDDAHNLYLSYVLKTVLPVPVSPTMLVSIASDGGSSDNYAAKGTISANGRYVVFESAATNLVAGDTNNQVDIFLYDLEMRQMERVSVKSDGTQSNDAVTSFPPLASDISADGRYLVFSTSAALVPEDTNGVNDIYLRDRTTLTTTRLQILSAGANGQQSTGLSVAPSISDDGQWISFISRSDTLVANPPTNAYSVYVYNRLTNEIRLIGFDTPSIFYADAPAVSGNGEYVAFVSENPNLVSGDTNGVADIFVYGVASGQIERVSFQVDGNQSSYAARFPSISADGQRVAYQGVGLELGVGEAVFVYNRATAQTIWASKPPADQTPNASMTTTEPDLSDDGSMVVFSTNIPLLADDTNGMFDVYAFDIGSEIYERISLSASGQQLTSFSGQPTISADKSRIVFTSWADVMENETSSFLDVFMRMR